MLRALIKKEFLQILRNPAMRPILILMPVIQLIILGNAATFDLKYVKLEWIDADQSALSKEIRESVQASGFFEINEFHYGTANTADGIVKRGAHAVVKIPAGLEKTLVKEGSAAIQLLLDAVDGNAASLTSAYIQQIVAGVNQNRSQRLGLETVHAPILHPISRYWYNPNLEYDVYMVPGILVLLVTMIGTFLSSMNVVREREIGTIEQLNVTPLKKWQFMVGKLFPFWVIGLVELGIGFVVAKLLFHIDFVGSVALLFVLASLYLVGLLGLGLLISTTTETMQQAMFTAWFMLVVFIMMSGLFTPIESMPDWAQRLTLFNPIAHFMKIMRNVLLKGSELSDVAFNIWALLIFAIASVTAAVSRYQKTTE